jgi:hypothetical protein
MKVLYTPDLLASPLATLRAVEDFLGAPRVRLHPGDQLDDLFNTRECDVRRSIGAHTARSRHTQPWVLPGVACSSMCRYYFNLNILGPWPTSDPGAT